MYNLTRNNYHHQPKNSTIYTPPEVSQFLFNLLRAKMPRHGLIFDPGCGQNSLLKPWQENGYPIWGNDNDSQLLTKQIPHSDSDFLTSQKQQWQSYFAEQEPTLILCNPPFNGYGKQLGAEVWLDKMLELFGKDMPLVLFVPMGFRLNSKKQGRRWNKFTNDTYPPITSIISLPRDIFTGVEFHSEILIFNIKGLQPHYFFNPTSKIEARTPI